LSLRLEANLNCPLLGSDFSFDVWGGRKLPIHDFEARPDRNPTSVEVFHGLKVSDIVEHDGTKLLATSAYSKSRVRAVVVGSATTVMMRSSRWISIDVA
jgi:hypothetical protein